MRRTGCSGGIIGTLLLLGMLGVLFIYSGIYDVSATRPDGPIAAWLLSTTMDRSVEQHAAGIKTPSLDDPAMVRRGFVSHRDMCAGCHGAPGVPAGDFVRSLNPQPPPMTDVAGEWEPKELFWIMKNGIRMSGMPAWGVTQSDAQIWDIVAFTKGLPSMKPADYKKLDRQNPRPARP